jgi:hypothetical protein
MVEYKRVTALLWKSRWFVNTNLCWLLGCDNHCVDYMCSSDSSRQSGASFFAFVAERFAILEVRHNALVRLSLTQQTLKKATDIDTVSRGNARYP